MNQGNFDISLIIAERSDFVDNRLESLGRIMDDF